MTYMRDSRANHVTMATTTTQVLMGQLSAMLTSVLANMDWARVAQIVIRTVAKNADHVPQVIT